MPTSLKDAPREHFEGIFARTISGEVFHHSIRNTLKSGSISVGSKSINLTLDEFAVVGMADPVQECATSCANSVKCAAFSVSVHNGNVCTLLRMAVLQPPSKALAASVVGWRSSHTPQSITEHFAHYFVGKIDGGSIASSVVNHLSDDAMYTDVLEGILRFDPSVNQINVRIATSFISIEQAWKNYERAPCVYRKPCRRL